MVDKLLEKLAELHHNIWMGWAGQIMSHENISEKRKERWLMLLRPYEALSEADKKKDRYYARKAIKIFKEVKP